MRTGLFGTALLVVVALVTPISCSENGDQTNSADIPLRTTEATSDPAAVPTAPPPSSARPQNDEGFFDELLVGLEDLGVGSRHAVCIINSLEERGADERALEAAELDSVLLLDEASRSCLVDLVQHIESGSDISRSVAQSDR